MASGKAAQTFLDGLAVADSGAQVREAMAYRWMLAHGWPPGWRARFFAQGKHDEAAAFAAESAQAAPPETVEAQARSLAAVARAASAASNHYRAENIARQAVDRAPQDIPNLRADVMVDLAEVLRAAGHEREAVAIADGAARLYEGKGNTASMARIEQFASG